MTTAPTASGAERKRVWHYLKPEEKAIVILAFFFFAAGGITVGMVSAFAPWTQDAKVGLTFAVWISAVGMWVMNMFYIVAWAAKLRTEA